MPKPVQLQTPRLLLRQWRPSDREPFAAMNADARVMAYYPAVLTRAESDVLADRIETRITEAGWGFWATEDQRSGEFLGFVGLNVPSADLPFSPCVEIGWRLAHAHWGKGYATEAARAALTFGFERLDLLEIVAFATLGNLRSQAVMQRLGMRPSGGFDHPQIPVDSSLQAHCLYRLARTDWAAHKDQ